MDKKELGYIIATGSGVGILLGYGLHDICGGVIGGISYILMALLIRKFRK